jgi:hypothetical protein
MSFQEFEREEPIRPEPTNGFHELYDVRWLVERVASTSDDSRSGLRPLPQPTNRINVNECDHRRGRAQTELDWSMPPSDDTFHAPVIFKSFITIA